VVKLWALGEGEKENKGKILWEEEETNRKERKKSRKKKRKRKRASSEAIFV